MEMRTPAFGRVTARQPGVTIEGVGLSGPSELTVALSLTLPSVPFVNSTEATVEVEAETATVRDSVTRTFTFPTGTTSNAELAIPIRADLPADMTISAVVEAAGQTTTDQVTRSIEAPLANVDVECSLTPSAGSSVAPDEEVTVNFTLTNNNAFPVLAEIRVSVGTANVDQFGLNVPAGGQITNSETFTPAGIGLGDVDIIGPSVDVVSASGAA